MHSVTRIFKRLKRVALPIRRDWRVIFAGGWIVLVPVAACIVTIRLVRHAPDTGLTVSYITSDRTDDAIYSTHLKEASAASNGSASPSSSHPLSDQTQSTSNLPSVEYIPIGIQKAESLQTLQKTRDIFISRVEPLKEALSGSGFYFLEKRLDESVRTSALILARNERYAVNMNGYFYYLLDENLSGKVVSPVILNLGALFDEENREKVTSDGSFAREDLCVALKKSLAALLASDYSDEVYDFIIEGYRDTFRSRIEGRHAKASIYRLRSGSLEVRFHDSFMTYVEFYMMEE